jgi:formate hydrogenlyase subunit 4
LIEWAAQLKLMIYAVLIINLFAPWGIAEGFAPIGLAQSVVAVSAKLLLLGALLAVGETSSAKIRLFQVPTYLAVAYALALIGMLSFVILEAG